MSAAANRAAIATLAEFKINSTTPFADSPYDLAITLADQVHALSLVLSIAVDELTDKASETSPLRNVHVSRALDALSSLSALTVFAMQGIDA